ncbi:hypothetical protein [uncultured Sunxiuqinia sp.]|uniref:hypothetical protein n=1 Tax=uncultured Sunxiuqinia sp. TaxID=1573825 RepID=UPI002AA7FDB8|nr:hypothetical protein [uncultured Sunxiuqinia sp.]
MRQIELIEGYILAWNTLNPALLDPILDDKVEYHSQMVLDVLKGKTAVLEYYGKMFETINKNNSPVIAENAFLNNIPCTVLTQFFIDDGLNGNNTSLIKEGTTECGFKYNYRDSVILFEFKDEKISKINLCITPNPSEINKTAYTDLRNEKIKQLENLYS